jgi:thioredoxin-related protein
MKHTKLQLATTLLIAAIGLYGTVLPIGAEMPKSEVKMKDVSGNLVSLKEAIKENGLLVMFSCNTCPYVHKNQSRIKSICEYALKNNIGVILLNANEGGRRSGESYPEMQQYAKQQSYNWFYAMDSESLLADAFGATRTPECFLFDKNNRLQYHGAIDDSPADITEMKRQHLQLAMAELLSDKPISVTQSRSIGCSIRRAGN